MLKLLKRINKIKIGKVEITIIPPTRNKTVGTSLKTKNVKAIPKIGNKE